MSPALAVAMTGAGLWALALLLPGGARAMPAVRWFPAVGDDPTVDVRELRVQPQAITYGLVFGGFVAWLLS